MRKFTRRFLTDARCHDRKLCTWQKVLSCSTRSELTSLIPSTQRCLVYSSVKECPESWPRAFLRRADGSGRPRHSDCPHRHMFYRLGNSRRFSQVTRPRYRAYVNSASIGTGMSSIGDIHARRAIRPSLRSATVATARRLSSTTSIRADRYAEPAPWSGLPEIRTGTGKFAKPSIFGSRRRGPRS